jgi:5-dehydro-4-deoxyglucarate dehydratase
VGNNGEIFLLSREEQKLVGRTVVEEVRGRKPVLVGVGYALPVVLELVKAAEAYGADGILVLPPSVTPANDDGLVDYYRAIAASTKLGIVLFPRSPPRYDVSDACLQFQRRSASLAFERSPTSWL